jgi:hypothetical protein
VAPRPDLVVFLDADTEVIRGRIRERGIAAEQVIPADYLNNLRERYYRLWDSYTEAPVHIVRTDDVDYVRDDGVVVGNTVLPREADWERAQSTLLDHMADRRALVAAAVGD